MTVLRRFGLLAPLAAFSLAGCGLNSVPTAEEQVNASWGNLQSEYQRRADLVPNLVATVKGYAQQEKSVLTEVTEARAKASSIQLKAERPHDPAKVAQFNRPRSARRIARPSFVATFEAYPDLKSNQNFLTLQASSKAPRIRSWSRAATIISRCRPITPASAPSPTRSAPRSSTAPSPRCRSRPPPPRRKRPRSTSTPPAEVKSFSHCCGWRWPRWPRPPRRRPFRH